MSDKQSKVRKSDKKNKKPGSDRSLADSSGCFYVVDACGCCVIDPCGCYVSQCNC